MGTIIYHTATKGAVKDDFYYRFKKTKTTLQIMSFLRLNVLEIFYLVQVWKFSLISVLPAESEKLPAENSRDCAEF